MSKDRSRSPAHAASIWGSAWQAALSVRFVPSISLGQTALYTSLNVPTVSVCMVYFLVSAVSIPDIHLLEHQLKKNYPAVGCPVSTSVHAASKKYIYIYIYIYYKLRVYLNPNPHCFIAITKAKACGWKEPLLPHPQHSPMGGGGRGVLPLRLWRFA
jgi:hypothetical protein